MSWNMCASCDVANRGAQRILLQLLDVGARHRDCSRRGVVEPRNQVIVVLPPPDRPTSATV